MIPKWLKRSVEIEDAPVGVKVLLFVGFLIGLGLTKESLTANCRPLLDMFQSDAMFDPGPHILFSGYLHLIRWLEPGHQATVLDVSSWEMIMMALLSLTLLLPRVPLLVTAGGQVCLLLMWTIFREFSSYGHAIESWCVILCAMLLVEFVLGKGERRDTITVILFGLVLGFMPLMRESAVALIIIPCFLIIAVAGLMALSDRLVKGRLKGAAHEKQDQNLVRGIFSVLIFLAWSLAVQYGGVAFWTLETGRPFLHHGSGNPLYMSLGFAGNPYNIVWDDDGTMADSLLIDKVPFDQTSADDQKRLRNLWYRRLREDPGLAWKGMAAKGTYLLRLFSGLVDPRSVQIDLAPVGGSPAPALLLLVFCSCLAVCGRILFRLRSDRALIAIAGGLGLLAASILPLLMIVPFYCGSCVAVFLSVVLMLTPAALALERREKREPSSRRAQRNSLALRIFFGAGLAILIAAGGFTLYRATVNRADAEQLLAENPLPEFAALGARFADRFNRLSVDEQETIVARLLSSEDRASVFRADPRQAVQEKIFRPVLAIAGDRMVAVIARMSRDWRMSLPSRVQGPRNSVLLVLKNSDTAPGVLPYGGYPYNFHKINDGSWDGRFRMFCLPRPAGGDSDAQYFNVTALNFIDGSHAGGLVLEPISGERLMRGNLIPH